MLPAGVTRQLQSFDDPFMELNEVRIVEIRKSCWRETPSAIDGIVAGMEMKVYFQHAFPSKRGAHRSFRAAR